jgi:Effector-associated domain 1
MTDDDELTRDEIVALAGAFYSPDSAKTLLRLARFPRAAIPLGGYSNSLGFWTLIADEVASGTQAGMRGDILRTASGLLPANRQLAAFAAAQGDPPPTVPARPDGPPGSPGSGDQATVTGSQGNQIGDKNLQINIFTGAPSPDWADGPPPAPASPPAAKTRPGPPAGRGRAAAPDRGQRPLT